MHNMPLGAVGSTIDREIFMLKIIRGEKISWCFFIFAVSLSVLLLEIANQAVQRCKLP